MAGFYCLSTEGTKSGDGGVTGSGGSIQAWKDNPRRAGASPRLRARKLSGCANPVLQGCDAAGFSVPPGTWKWDPTR